MNITAQNQTEKELEQYLKANTSTANVRLSLHSNNEQNKVQPEAVNTCFVDIDGINRTFENISENFFDSMYNEYDLKSAKGLSKWRKAFERR